MNENPNSIKNIPTWQIAHSVEVWGYCIQQEGNRERGMVIALAKGFAIAFLAARSAGRGD